LLSLAAFGVTFALISLLSANSRQVAQRTYRQIRGGESFPTAFLVEEAQRADESGQGVCDGDANLALSLIELKLAESSLAEGRSEAADAHLRSASSAAREQIACSPTNGFAWFVAFWSEFLSGNLLESKWRYIDASYQFAPREVWVALIRLPLLANLWSAFPPDRRRFVLDDFEMLLNAGYAAQCARLYAFALPDLQVDIRVRLTKVAEAKKHQFNSFLRAYDAEPIATEKGRDDAARLRKSLKGLSDALGGVVDR
jgi:hypothetical protein